METEKKKKQEAKPKEDCENQILDDNAAYDKYLKEQIKRNFQIMVNVKCGSTKSH